MGKIICITGYCATGKSTFAKKMSEELLLPYFSKDTLKENLADSIGNNYSDVIDSLSQTTFNLMRFISNMIMTADKDFILESNFKPAEGQIICKLIDKYHYQSLTFLFLGDLNVLYDRYINRDKSCNRHWVHRKFEENRKYFIDSQKSLGDIYLGNNITKVDTTNFSNVNYANLLNIATDFLNK